MIIYAFTSGFHFLLRRGEEDKYTLIEIGLLDINIL